MFHSVENFHIAFGDNYTFAIMLQELRKMAKRPQGLESHRNPQSSLQLCARLGYKFYFTSALTTKSLRAVKII